MKDIDVIFNLLSKSRFPSIITSSVPDFNNAPHYLKEYTKCLEELKAKKKNILHKNIKDLYKIAQVLECTEFLDDTLENFIVPRESRDFFRIYLRVFLLKALIDLSTKRYSEENLSKMLFYFCLLNEEKGKKYIREYFNNILKDTIREFLCTYSSNKGDSPHFDILTKRKVLSIKQKEEIVKSYLKKEKVLSQDITDKTITISNNISFTIKIIL